jgi:hypothetical protein
MLPEHINKLYSFASGGLLKDEILKARAEFFSDVKDVYVEEHFFEERVNAFLEWYSLDRVVGRSGRTPLDLFLESCGGELSAEEAGFFEALRSSRHSLFRLQRHDSGVAVLDDAFAGDRLQVAVDRPMVTLKKGDLIDTRLIPLADGLCFGRSFLVHPRSVRRSILLEVKRAKSSLRLDAQAFLRQLSVMWIRQQRYKGVKPTDLYTTLELSRPNAPLF